MDMIKIVSVATLVVAGLLVVGLVTTAAGVSANAKKSERVNIPVGSGHTTIPISTQCISGFEYLVTGQGGISPKIGTVAPGGFGRQGAYIKC